MSALLLTLSVTISSALNCKYFGVEPDNGFLIPIGVCKQYKLGVNYPTSSYEWRCFLGMVQQYFYYGSSDCSGDVTGYGYEMWKPENSNCAGTAGTCNHLTVKKYRGMSSLKHECSKKEDEFWVEHAYVTGCWNSDYGGIAGSSWDLTCNDNSFNLKHYQGPNCDLSSEALLYDDSFGSGCDWFNITQTIKPVLNSSNIPYNIPNITFGNLTYHEITACGGATSWLWLWILIPSVLCCCYLCCFVLYCYNKRRRKKKEALIVNNGKTIGEQTYGGYAITEGF